MNKRKILVASLIVVLPIGILLGLWSSLASKSASVPYICPFCQDKILTQQSLYEGTHLRVLYNYAPMLPGHIMIIPKRHVMRIEDWNTDELTELGPVIKRVQRAFQQVYHTSDFLMVMQNGVNAGQTVYHSHFHLLPREEKNLFTKIWLWGMILTRPIAFLMIDSPEEMQTKVMPLKEALQ